MPSAAPRYAATDYDRFILLHRRFCRLLHESAYGDKATRLAAMRALEIVVPDLCESLADLTGEPIPAGWVEGTGYVVELPVGDEDAPLP